jgi:hypothetical protein
MVNDSEQVTSSASGDSQLPFSLNLEDSVNLNLTWKLTSDEAYNTTLREEFGFEHAPSVSLCLAILKLHSEHVAYPRLVIAIIMLEQQLSSKNGPNLFWPPSSLMKKIALVMFMSNNILMQLCSCESYSVECSEARLHLQFIQGMQKKKKECEDRDRTTKHNTSECFVLYMNKAGDWI